MKKIIAIAVFAVAMAANSAFAEVSHSVDRSSGIITVYCIGNSNCNNVTASVSIKLPNGNDFCYKWDIPTIGRGQSVTLNILKKYPGAEILGVDCE
ncbi:MAG: hypothetical protein LBU89_04820 [Fibromonadaceae bacterium]|jgi:hypothetical protein|nr:hypothetical protein [Fibromonadaceae bacterium]